MPTQCEDQSVLCNDRPVPAIDATDSNSLDCITRVAPWDYRTSHKASYHPSNNVPPSEKENLAKQVADSHPRHAALHIGAPHSEFCADCRGILARKSLLDMSVRVVVPASQHRRILYLCSFWSTVGRPGKWRMYDTCRRKICWSYMASDVQRTVARCVCCVRTASGYCRKKRLLQVPPFNLIDFVAMNIHDPSPNTQQSNQLIIAISNHYSKLKRAIPTSKISSTHMAEIFFEIRIAPFCIPEFKIIDNDPQFVSKLFKILCADREVKHFTTTSHRLPNKARPKDAIAQ